VSETALYHVVLIGCDLYPPEQRSLAGCVSDIDGVEQLLLGEPGVGIPNTQIRLTRLAAPLPNARSTSRFLSQTELPTKSNIVATLKALAGPAVGPADRVLIYYSGHGGQVQRLSRMGWYECLVPCDEQLLYDFEMNALIAAVAQRTSDVTVVLDCCHSAGATRDVYAGPAHGASRVAELRGLPDEVLESVIRTAGAEGTSAGARLLQTLDPNYVVIAACQADEKAQEDALAGAVQHGFLTYSLLKIMAHADWQQRSRIRWADIWPRLLLEIHLAAAKTGRTVQHPWIIGRPERRVFGGHWHPQDPGFQIRHGPDHRYSIEAGTLVGVTEGAVLGVYGPSPDRFPPVGSSQDDAVRIGMVKVTGAERAVCVAEPVEPPPDPLPTGVRARLIRPGDEERLRVWVDESAPSPVKTLAESPMLQLAAAGDLTPEVWVQRSADGWEVSNDTNSAIASVRISSAPGRAPCTEEVALAHTRLRDGLNSYARYNRVLRFAKNCNDPELDQSIALILHDCSDADQLQQVDPKRPELPELHRNAEGIYDVAADTPYSIRLSNFHWRTLHLTVFNCTSLGMVEFLGEVTVKSDDVETLWLGGIQQTPFQAIPDDPNVNTIDRIVAIATTNPAVALRWLEVRETVQQVIDQTARGSGTKRVAFAEDLWTASVVPLKIRQRQSPGHRTSAAHQHHPTPAESAAFPLHARRMAGGDAAVWAPYRDGRIS
jgi:Caspase domain